MFVRDEPVEEWEDPIYEPPMNLDVIANLNVCHNLADAMHKMGLVNFEAECPPGALDMGSTDQGKVTYRCPGIHAGYFITDSVISNHTKKFTSVADSPEAETKTLQCAAGMGMVASALFLDKDFARRVH
ncbi:uncharacterized protein LY89DRAFT_756137 [Mollisia scopiformis]|uniref:Uncharacterized protein n=1 Tax=Mollisia scopiformis TaxID=149040 RepID=A0A194WYA2_MOLSC|nr:uncharacterized protein LY89DRAFT_756137 [Mollisia scopiformis]KUJ12915.1 hypothetical protein LY89DRAFT_756137 [Mollisia scopiformis]